MMTRPLFTRFYWSQKTPYLQVDHAIISLNVIRSHDLIESTFQFLDAGFSRVSQPGARITSWGIAFWLLSVSVSSSFSLYPKYTKILQMVENIEVTIPLFFRLRNFLSQPPSFLRTFGTFCLTFFCHRDAASTSNDAGQCNNLSDGLTCSVKAILWSVFDISFRIVNLKTFLKQIE